MANSWCGTRRWDSTASEGLQRRAAARSRSAHLLAAGLPAYYVAFDLLQQDGTELLTLPYRERRRRLEVLFAAHSLTAPFTLCPMTTDPATAREWMTHWTEVPGLEGLVVKAQGQRYLTGARAWTKVRRRDTTEALIGAITGSLAHPKLLILARHDTAGRLRTIGRTVLLRPDTARQVAEHLHPGIPGRACGSPLPGQQRCPRGDPGPPRLGGRDQRRPLRRPRRRFPPPSALCAPAHGRERAGHSDVRGGTCCLRRLTEVTGLWPGLVAGSKASWRIGWSERRSPLMVVGR
ncbi:hypothetical protein [Streptomyces sp. NPDC001828]|uniref:ATP-dependent DNA ligase n=1 Tax=Streptomyces sp. NPDC001828 TaxID=3364615 RepID=UPI003680A8A0